MNSSVLFIFYLPLLFLFFFEEIKGQAENLAQVRAIAKGSTFIVFEIVIGPSTKSGEYWLEICDTSGTKIADKVFCQRVLEANNGTTSFACHIDGLSCGTMYGFKLLCQEQDELIKYQLIKETTSACSSIPKGKRKKKK